MENNEIQGKMKKKFQKFWNHKLERKEGYS